MPQLPFAMAIETSAVHVCCQTMQLGSYENIHMEPLQPKMHLHKGYKMIILKAQTDQ